MIQIPTEVLSTLLPLVKSSEGCKLSSYKDPNGVWTIGWGHIGPEVVEDLTWTQSQADTVLVSDMDLHYTQLIEVSPSLLRSSAQRQAALADFVYNLGIGTYMHSTLRGAVDRMDWDQVKGQLALWVHAGGKVENGLVRRRNQEIILIDAD